PFPFRTRKLSLLPPMVLYGKLYGRVGRCRHYFEGRDECLGPFFLATPATAPFPSHYHRRRSRPGAATRRCEKSAVWETVRESRSLPALSRRPRRVSRPFLSGDSSDRTVSQPLPSAAKPRCEKTAVWETVSESRSIA